MESRRGYGFAMNNFILSIGLLLTPLFSFADVEYFRMGKGQVMAYEYVSVENAKGTLILLPGVNRGLTARESAVVRLKNQGWNVLLPSLPSHPLSIRGLETTETPDFASETRVQDYARNLEALVEGLDIHNAIPVSLSYSASISSYLDSHRFSRIIDTVPIVTATETNPEAAEAAQSIESVMLLNPFLGPFWVRNFRDYNYRNYWKRTVTQNLESSPGMYGPSPRVESIIDGYVAIARAVEDFDFTQINFSQDEQIRDFIIAGKEHPLRLQKQLQVLQNYVASGKPCRIVVVQNAGHILPSDQPTAYANIIAQLAATSDRQNQIEFALVKNNSESESLQWQGPEAFYNWLNANIAAH